MLQREPKKKEKESKTSKNPSPHVTETVRSKGRGYWRELPLVEIGRQQGRSENDCPPTIDKFKAFSARGCKRDPEKRGGTRKKQWRTSMDFIEIGRRLEWGQPRCWVVVGNAKKSLP